MRDASFHGPTQACNHSLLCPSVFLGLGSSEWTQCALCKPGYSLMNLRLSGLLWSSVGISCFHLGSHYIGLLLTCESRPLQPHRLLQVWVITSCRHLRCLCPDLIVKPTWLHLTVGAPQESGPNQAQVLDQILVEETWYCGVAAGVSRRESAWDLTVTMCARLQVGRMLFPSASSPGTAMAQHVLSEASTLWSDKQGMEQTGRTRFPISASFSSLYT